MPKAQPCLSCKEPIFFAQTPSGSWMPLDAGPVEDGNVVLVKEEAIVLGKATLFEDQYPGLPRYKSHYATCPAAEKHRKRHHKRNHQ